MSKQQIFVNLPVRDLERSKTFFGALGFAFNPQFTDEKAACMIVSDEHSYVMLLEASFFQTFTKKPVADARASTEVLVALSQDSRAAVDDMVARAVAAGGSIPRPPVDYGFMYQHAFEDPDGHIWELAYMESMPPQEGSAAA